MATNENGLAFEQQGVEGLSVIVTGGTTGIGRATALLLASKGADVLIAGADQQHMDDTLRVIDEEGLADRIRGIVVDLSTEQGIQQLFEKADSELKGLDVLINNAAMAYQSVTGGNYNEWAKVVNTNLTGYLACSHMAIERMKEQKRGHIINVGSMSADVRETGSAVYVATKSGIQGFSESLRKEINELGIKVTLIEPGAVGTDMQPVSVSDQEGKQEKLEMLKSEDIAYAILFTLAQPMRCDVVEMRIRPHMQLI